jgi:hypothetical protein
MGTVQNVDFVLDFMSLIVKFLAEIDFLVI